MNREREAREDRQEERRRDKKKRAVDRCTKRGRTGKKDGREEKGLKTDGQREEDGGSRKEEEEKIRATDTRRKEMTRRATEGENENM